MRRGDGGGGHQVDQACGGGGGIGFGRLISVFG